jgi:putative membrane protein insertion efficiency factor
MSQLPARCLSALFRFYQLAVSPWLAPACRFQPTCSQYAIDAIQEWGALKGSWFAMRRVGRCHPLGGTGYDPIRNRVTDGS